MEPSPPFLNSDEHLSPLEGQSTPPPRNSMEDEDASVKRKRPRLDSGQRAYHNMKADHLSSGEHASTNIVDSSRDAQSVANGGDASPRAIHPRSPSPGQPADSAATGTPSKVTLNLRDPVISLSPSPPQQHQQQATVDLHQQYEEVQPSPHLSQAVHDNDNNDIASTSAAATAASPVTLVGDEAMSDGIEIEIADPEDMDAPPQQTVWRSASQPDWRRWHLHHLRQFPIAGSMDRPWDEAIVGFWRTLTSDAATMNTYLAELNAWVQSYLDESEGVPDRWREMLLLEPDCWRHIAKMYRSVHRAEFLDIVDAASNSEVLDGDKVVDMLDTLMSLTTRFLKVDAQTLQILKEDKEAQVTFFAFEYLGAIELTWCHRRVRNALEGLSVESLTVSLQERFIEKLYTEPSFLKAASAYWDAALNLGRPDPAWMEITNRLLKVATALCQEWLDIRTSAEDQVMALANGYCHLFRSFAEKMQSAIKKQSPVVNVELFKRFADSMSLVITSIVPLDTSFLDKVLSGIPLDGADELLMEDRHVFAKTAWKLVFLEKSIRHGRMEIRIAALDCLSKMLIEIYTQYITHGNDVDHPIVKWTSQTLRDTSLIEYLLSVDSHPQLVTRSNNVIGFLAASHTYGSGQTDMIWNTIRKSEDPRMFEAVVGALNTTMTLLDSPALLYFCTKLQEIPTVEFDHRWRALFGSAVEHLQRCWQYEENFELLPHRVMLRLLRDIGTDPSITANRRAEIWMFVQELLQKLSFQRWELAQRLEIYRECLADFAAKDGKATGTCLVFSRFLEYYGQADLHALAEVTDVAVLVVSEFCHLKEIRSSSGVDLEAFSHPIKERLRILQMMIVHVPETIPAELNAALWDSLVGKNAVNRQVRNDAWDTLATIAGRAATANSFLDFGVENFIPHLDVESYSRCLLNFARHLWDYQTRLGERPLATGQGTSFDARKALYWQLAVYSKDESTVAGAGKLLVDGIIHETNVLSKDRLSEGQVDFIRKCVDRLMECAQKRKELIESSVLEHDSKVSAEISAESVKCQKAFMMLKQLSQGLNALEQQPPSERSDSSTSQRSIHGDRIEIKYQFFDRGVGSNIRSLEIGDKSTVGDLVEWIRAKTGFAKFNLIAGGSKVDQEAYGSRTLSESSLATAGMIIVHKIPGSETVSSSLAPQRLMPLEKEILKYFHQLYNLLAVESTLGQLVLEYLCALPVHEDIATLVTDPSQTKETILPQDEPYKLIYSLQAMRSVLQRQLEEAAIDEEFMVRSVTMIVKTLLAIEPSAKTLHAHVEMMCHYLINTLLKFLKEPVRASICAQYFEKPILFVDKLMKLCDAAQSENVFTLSQSSFDVLLEAARLNKAVWVQFRNHASTPNIFKLLLLANPKMEGRDAAKRTIMSILSTLSGFDSDLTIDSKKAETGTQPDMAFEEPSFLGFVWDVLASIMPAASVFAPHSAQFFDLSLQVFKRRNSVSLDAAALQKNLDSWFELLLAYKHDESIGQDHVDQFVKGVAEHIHQTILAFKELPNEAQVDDMIVERLFTHLLFPPITMPAERSSTTTTLPILSSETRGLLYTITLYVSNNVGRLLSCIQSALSALKQIEPNFTMNYERQRNIRSSAGYPGLVNLSNTCYLNSLTTQLFMNPRFREFILKLKLEDINKQGLLFALRQLFADLQDGVGRAVLTQDLADSIETYEGPLDPQVQMDADEAFNLLFDRIESQLSSSDDKERFKTIFGGQIVQQIKSKECDHISERLEPVTAVQCDIQGKGRLEDSLRSYIEGEVMEGDNKYKCSTCDRYVNAVKRACLRDVPDNLIFHLKRFDFDLVQGTRSKLNEYFSFPERIDMTPYTDKFLQDPTAPSVTDTFVLVGVLVHSGSAELGHYYSFIRERPTALNTWVEFNDAEVSRFDVRHMQDHCFGGTVYDGVTGAYWPKSYSAYMLFYQRESSLQTDDDHFRGPDFPAPVHVEIPHDIALDLATRNEVTARSYCLFDPTHLRFIIGIATRRSSLIGRGSCTEDHELESQTLVCLWTHFSDIFARDHSRQGCKEVLDIVIEMMLSCVRCCYTSIDWLLDGNDEQRLRLLLLRQPDPAVRVKLCNLLCDGMAKLRQTLEPSYGFTVIEQGEGIEGGESLSVNRFHLLMMRLRVLQTLLHTHPRSWPEYYDLLTGLASLGAREKAIIHGESFLLHALEILLIDNEHDWTGMFPGRHVPYMKAIEKRTISLTGLVRFVAAMLPAMGMSPEGVEDGDVSEGPPFVSVLSDAEISLLMFTLRSNNENRSYPAFLERLAINDDFAATDHVPLRNVVRWAIQAEATLHLAGPVECLIRIGLDKNPAWLAEPYLHIALAYIGATEDEKAPGRIMNGIASSVKTIDVTGGAEHFDFFKRVGHVRNAKAFPDRPDRVKFLVMDTAPIWAFTLLTFPKEQVGERTRQLIEESTFPSDDDHDDEELSEAKSRALQAVFAQLIKCLSRVLSQRQTVGENYIEVIKFCESALPYGFPDDTEEERPVRQSQIKEMIQRVQGCVVISDEGSDANRDSDELTDVSSTEAMFQGMKGNNAADPIEL